MARPIPRLAPVTMAVFPLRAAPRGVEPMAGEIAGFLGVGTGLLSLVDSHYCTAGISAIPFHTHPCHQ
jgi:hypothetical protein